MTALPAPPTAATPDSHDYPTRSYDLVKEFVIALAVMTGLSLVLAGDLLLTRRPGDHDVAAGPRPLPTTWSRPPPASWPVRRPARRTARRTTTPPRVSRCSA